MKKTIAIVSHDSRKEEMLEWVNFNKDILVQHNIVCTGTTGRLIEGLLKIDVEKKASGMLGGDQQIGSMIAESKIDILIFFCDNLITQGHQQDVGALSRLASLYNIAFATNRTTADMILTSSLFNNDEYERIIPAAIERYKNRTL